MATQPETNEDSSRAVVPMSHQREGYAILKDKARMFAMSPLIPDHLRNGGPDMAMANCLIALQMAEAMGEMPLVVMQNIHIVKGKAGFAAQYMIARANASTVFRGRINWRIKGTGDNLSATAFATLAETGEEVAFTCDMAMARAENWVSNPKYKSMPEVMLRYRSATFLVRFYAPDVMLGYQSMEEIEDVVLAARPINEPVTAHALLEQAKTDVEPEPEPTPQPAATDLPGEAGPTNEATDAAAAPQKGEGLFEKMSALARGEGPADTDRGEEPTLDEAKAAVDKAGSIEDVNGLVASYQGQLSDEDHGKLQIHAMNAIAALPAESPNP